MLTHAAGMDAASRWLLQHALCWAVTETCLHARRHVNQASKDVRGRVHTCT